MTSTSANKDPAMIPPILRFFPRGGGEITAFGANGLFPMRMPTPTVLSPGFIGMNLEMPLAGRGAAGEGGADFAAAETVPAGATAAIILVESVSVPADL